MPMKSVRVMPCLYGSSSAGLVASPFLAQHVTTADPDFVCLNRCPSGDRTLDAHSSPWVLRLVKSIPLSLSHHTIVIPPTLPESSFAQSVPQTIARNAVRLEILVPRHDNPCNAGYFERLPAQQITRPVRKRRITCAHLWAIVSRWGGCQPSPAA